MNRKLGKGRVVAVVAVAVMAMAVLPSTGAEAGDLAAGAVTGTIAYATPSDECELGTANVVATFTTEMFATAAVGSYVGPLFLSGTGDSICEISFGGAGYLTLSAVGTNGIGGSLDCLEMTGAFIYTPIWDSTATGDCTVNGSPATLEITIIGLLTATPPGGGFTTPRTGGILTGTLTAGVI